MENIEDYHNDIQNWIKSGFFSKDDINWKISSLGIEHSEAKSFISSSFENFNKQNKTSEDVIKLQELFDELSYEGYITLHKAGHTASDVFDKIDLVIRDISVKPFGYISYNEQDLFRAIENNELTLSFGSFRDTIETKSNGLSKEDSAKFFKSRLEQKGFNVDWNGDPKSKMLIKGIAFMKTYDGQDWSYKRCVRILNKIEST